MSILLGLNKVDIKDGQKLISVDSRYSPPHAHPSRGIFRWHDPQPLCVSRQTVGLLSLQCQGWHSVQHSPTFGRRKSTAQQSHLQAPKGQISHEKHSKYLQHFLQMSLIKSNVI